ncbi:MAG: histidinol-phosphate transaminase, partial [Fibrobacter sp.]|nr:histidinol-phosphate transaminase [Fibrobacter sp.]
MIDPRPELSKLSDYVPGKSMDEIRAKYGLTDVVKLASNENPLGPSPKAKEAYLKIVDTLHLYPRGDA